MIKNNSVFHLLMTVLNLIREFQELRHDYRRSESKCFTSIFSSKKIEGIQKLNFITFSRKY